MTSYCRTWLCTGDCKNTSCTQLHGLKLPSDHSVGETYKMNDKTAICLRWCFRGFCPKRNECNKAHGIREIKLYGGQPPKQSNRGIICSFWLLRGACTDCNHKLAHGFDEIDYDTDQYEFIKDTSSICLEWLHEGYCPNGRDFCSKTHRLFNFVGEQQQ